MEETIFRFITPGIHHNGMIQFYWKGKHFEFSFHEFKHTQIKIEYPLNKIISNQHKYMLKHLRKFHIILFFPNNDDGRIDQTIKTITAD